MIHIEKKDILFVHDLKYPSPLLPLLRETKPNLTQLRTNNSLRDNRTNRTNLNPLPPVPGEELWIGGVGPRPQEWPGGYPGDLGESLARGRGS